MDARISNLCCLWVFVCLCGCTNQHAVEFTDPRMKTDFVPGAIYRLNRPMLLTRLDGKIGNARAWFAPASPQQIEAARSGQFSGSKVLGVVGQETKIRCQSLVYEDYFENQKIWPVGTITTGAFKGESVLLPVQSRRGIWEFEIDKEYLSQTE